MTGVPCWMYGPAVERRTFVLLASLSMDSLSWMSAIINGTSCTKG